MGLLHVYSFYLKLLLYVQQSGNDRLKKLIFYDE